MVEFGEGIMDLHINYEQVELFNLLRKDDIPKVKKETPKLFLPKVKEPETMFGIKPKLKVKLKADKENGKILIDEITTLSRVPKLAWEYKLVIVQLLNGYLNTIKKKNLKTKPLQKNLTLTISLIIRKK